MRLNNISFLSSYAYISNQKNKNTTNITSPINNSVVTFSGIRDDRKAARKYFEEFQNVIADKEDKKFTKKQSQIAASEFFAKLKNESLSLQKEFLLQRTIDHENALIAAMTFNFPQAAKEILKLYEKTDEKTKAELLVSEKYRAGSPVLTALDTDKTNQIANKLARMAKTLTPIHQGEFYYRQMDSIYLKKNTLIEEVQDSGYNVFAALLREDKTAFDKKYPEIANQMQKLYPPLNEIPLKELREEKAAAKEEEEVKAPKNTRIYEHVKTRFSDVGGMFNVKKQIQNELLNIINNPKVKNSDKPSGIILYGPPGTGKTLLATAIAGEADVPLISANGSGFNEIYVGAGAKHVRELYNTARDLARKSDKKTVIVFIDEGDAVAGKRGKSSSGENDHTLNALLSELDGVQSKEENDIKVITIIATNRKDLFDDAFRKGRIDLEFKIDDPRFSEKARREILEINAKEKPFKNEVEKAKLLDELAKTSVGLSGAELADVIKKAYRKTLYVGREIEYITPKDITDAKLESLFGIKNDEETPDFEMKKTIAHEAGHAINYLIMEDIFKDETNKNRQPVRKLDLILNESRGDAAGMTISKPSENHRYTVESLISDLVARYGGYSIEEKMFDGHTDGVASDLRVNTETIINAVTKYGLGSKTKFIGCDTTGITFELFKHDIKNDLINYSNKAMEISEIISAFTKPFIEHYLEILETTNDKTAIITGETFEKMFKDWLKENGNKKEYNEMCLKIRKDIADFKKNIKS